MDGKAVGRRIKEAREKRHLTQEELAARIDISPTHVSVIERGTKIPRLDTFVAIANALEVSGDALLLDVVDHAAESQASDLSAALEGLPWEEKRRILKVVRTRWRNNERKSRGRFLFSFLWDKLRVTSTNPSLYTCAIER